MATAIWIGISRDFDTVRSEQLAGRDDFDVWIHAVGIDDGTGDSPGDVRFLVSSNTTGQPRAGAFIVGETPWRVTQ